MFFFNVVRFRVFSFFLKRASNLPESVDLVNTIFCSVFFQCGTFRVFSEVFPRSEVREIVLCISISFL